MGAVPDVKPTLLFVYDHPQPEWWLDGLAAALTLLEPYFEVRRHNLRQGPPATPLTADLVLGWGAFGSPVDHWLRQQPQRKGLCIAGNAFPPTHADVYDVLFYETKWYRPEITWHPNIVQAFGVNTDIYYDQSKSYPIPVVWDYIGVGALATWKRWGKFLTKQGNRLVVGEYQLNNPQESGQIATGLLAGGVMVSPLVHPFDLALLYQMSRTLYLPADLNGGGERAILEARACGLRVEIEDDNPKLKELLDGPIPSHHDYAHQLKKGLFSIL